ncbi:hypothetical protein L1887_23020 [Cichorium endivia]|nr:hypothetical protein L1887_23020 [Cichorium endivia]
MGIAILWLNMKSILLLCGQDEEIATQVQTYLIYSLPDLLAQSLLHPLQIYLRSQSITLPLTFCASLSIVLHIPINYYLVNNLNSGIKGVAISNVLTPKMECDTKSNPSRRSQFSFDSRVLILLH